MGTGLVHVVFTGLPRDLERFEASLRDLDGLRRAGLVGEVRLSTWAGAVDATAGAFWLLRRHGVRLVETPDERDAGEGNIWRQMRSLHEGLEKPGRIGDDELVLKTRCDVGIGRRFLEELIAGGAEPAGEVFGARVFERKVWIPWFEVTKPFYMGDECFFGRAGDLRKLNHFARKLYAGLENPGCGKTHVRRFVHPFLWLDPSVMAGFAADVGLFRETRWERLGRLLRTPWYQQALGSYYAIVRNCFSVGTGRTPEAVNFRAWSTGEVTVDGGSFAGSFDERCSCLPEGRLICAYSGEWIERLLEGRFDDEGPETRGVREAMERALGGRVAAGVVARVGAPIPSGAALVG